MSNFDEKARGWDADPERVRRANAAADAIRARVSLNPRMLAFEYGCGTGLLSFALQKDLGPITLADRSQAMLDVLSEKIAATGHNHMSPLLLDVMVDPLPATRFDITYNLMVLHHLEVDRALGAFLELLRPGGVLCVVDLNAKEGAIDEPVFGECTGWDHDGLAQRVTRAGFRNVVIETVLDINKVIEGVPMAFPAFLLTAEKP